MVTKNINADWATELSDKREALRLSRFGGGTAKTVNVKLARGLRREIARLLTKIHANRK